MDIKRKKIDVKEEERILISAITNTNFLKEIVPIARFELFSVPFVRTVYGWVKEYFDQYQEAPIEHINDLYEIYKDKLNDGDVNLIGPFLQQLDDKYDETFNEQFVIDKAVKYFRKRALLDISTKVKSLSELDKVEEAEEVWTNFKKISKQTSGWVNPNDIEFAKTVYKSDDKNRMILFPGALGDLFGWWNRGWLIIGQGVYGSGKSNFLKIVETLAMKERFKVVEFNLEMSEEENAKRYYRILTGRNEEESQFLYPVFDCRLNQIDACPKKERKNRVKLYSDDDIKPRWDKAPVDYRICNVCRGIDNDFEPESWYEPIVRETITMDYLSSRMRAFNRSYGDVYRYKCYPKFSANTSDMKRDLDLLEYSEDFVPDLIVVDYGEIMAPEDHNVNDNDEVRLNKTMMALAGMAFERKAMVVTVSQVKTHVLKERGRYSQMGDASGSARANYAHADFIFGFMQTNEEKESGEVRFNVVKNRYRLFNEAHEVIVLQHMMTGNALVDSERK